jgi:hypothetical protein
MRVHPPYDVLLLMAIFARLTIGQGFRRRVYVQSVWRIGSLARTVERIGEQL